MSQATQAPRPAVDDTDIKVRNRRMLMVGGVMVLLGCVVAAGYWITHQPGKAAPRSTALSITNAGGDLVVGSAQAKHQVVIDEAFNCSSCALFEQSALTYLHDDAASGIVRIRYVIPAGSNSDYSAALATNPAHALDVHDQLFAAGTVSGRPSSSTLTVTLDGKTLTASNPVSLADALETALAA